METVRSILLFAEAQPNTTRFYVPDVDGVSKPDIHYHLEIMEQAGLITTEDMTTFGSGHPEFVIRTITWQGQEFLSAARDDEVWNTTKRTIGEKFNGLGIDLVQRALTKIAWNSIDAALS